jgi:NAD(P)-dependent dehydrogenase (short-subunit alcohol dehydrogenase family)
MSQTFVVTGGGSGIGAAVVRRLVAHGGSVVAVGRRREPLEQLRAELGDAVEAVAADVSAPDGADAVAERVSRCDGVVTAAGGISPEPTEGSALERTSRAWQDAFASNVLSSVLVVEALRERLSAAGGRVVLISSIAALRGSGGGGYGATKAALHAYAFDLARELGRHGGTANVVAPGFVPDTGFWEGRRTPELIAERAAQTLVGREGTPDEVASLICWLLGPDGGWVTGQVLSPNGGVVLGR